MLNELASYLNQLKTASNVHVATVIYIVDKSIHTFSSVSHARPHAKGGLVRESSKIIKTMRSRRIATFFEFPSTSLGYCEHDSYWWLWIFPHNLCCHFECQDGAITYTLRLSWNFQLTLIGRVSLSTVHRLPSNLPPSNVALYLSVAALILLTFSVNRCFVISYVCVYAMLPVCFVPPSLHV